MMELYWVRYYDGYVMEHTKPRWGLARTPNSNEVLVIDAESLQPHTVNEVDIVEVVPVYGPYWAVGDTDVGGIGVAQ